MIKNYLLITIRSMMKNKLFIFINVFGLAIGIGCCIVAYFNWEFDAKFDSSHINANKIYRISSIREFEGTTTLFGNVPSPLGEIVRQNMPDVEKVVRINWSWSNFKADDNLFPGTLAYADPELFDVFSFDFINGSPSGLNDRLKVYLSDEMALKLFNSTDVVGKQITQVMGAVTKELQVGGVFRKPPANSSFHWGAYLNYENYYDEAREEKPEDWKARNTLFVMINDPSRLSTVANQLQP